MKNTLKLSKTYSLPKECEVSILRFLSKSETLRSKTKSEIEIFGKSIFETVIKFLVETKNDKITLQTLNSFLAGMPIKD